MFKLTRVRVLFIGLFLCLASACKDSDKVEQLSLFLNGRADDGFKTILSDSLRRDNIQNSALLVDVPRHGYLWQDAQGIADVKSTRNMQADDNFRIASAAKMFTAIRVLQLVEDGLLQLDQPLSELLRQNDMPEGYTLNQLNQFANELYGEQITVRQLLNHTSGLKDYIFDTATDSEDEVSLALAGVLDALGVQETGAATRQWNAKKILQYYFSNGLAQNAIAKPGDTFHYSDTNYVLLGILIEKLTNMSLADNYRVHIYQPAGMTKAYLEWHESHHSEAPVDHFMDLTELGLGNFNLVASGINTSADWSGGGVVTNTLEMKLFLKALFRDKRLLTQESLDLMLSNTVPLPVSSSSNNLVKLEYGLGVMKKAYRLPSGVKVELWGHEGIYGVLPFYNPKTQSTIIMTLNQTQLDEDWMYRVLKVLDQSWLFRVP
ncbi:serine hydrolase [Pleionea sp. CnH1-48]|uniref:serine hydrolase domain-containing protein n=1 Tax=Pleionea sp. CnH1-48 TaxID=2954494 RepID=UPI002097FFF5|nr:serine hydrolase [Pleionea sp. CnH1-48]MCO7223252.1 beta-lactamase family protein [Pleionea sp. CnH1-48]